MMHRTTQAIHLAGLLASVFCALLIGGFLGGYVFADEGYKDTQAYKDYLLLPDAYKSPELEASIKFRYDAENAVKNLPCVSGVTVSECLDTMAVNKGLDDLGWTTHGDGGVVYVERVFVTWTAKTVTYRWSVDAEGKVRAQNKEARQITRQ